MRSATAQVEFSRGGPTSAAHPFLRWRELDLNRFTLNTDRSIGRVPALTYAQHLAILDGQNDMTTHKDAGRRSELDGLGAPVYPGGNIEVKGP